MKHAHKPSAWQTFRHWILLHRYAVAIALILLLAIVLRFYNPYTRWGLASDQSGFALEARYALETHQLPLLGPFSSAGPFQTGGEWYWIVMLGTLWNMNWLFSPWLFITLLSVVFVYLMIRFADQLIDRRFALIVGLFTAVSTAEVQQATNLTNQTPIGWFALLAIFGMAGYIQKKQLRYLFVLGLAIGIASTIHLQGVALLPLAIFALLFGEYSLQSIAGEVGLVLLGIVIPWLPVLAVDVTNHFYNTKNMIYFYIFNPHKIPFEALGRRWLTFAGSFIPSSWGFITGGWKVGGYIVILGLVGLMAVGRNSLPQRKFWQALMASIVVMIIILRYTRTPIFDSYMMFLHPAIILVTALLVYKISQQYRYAAGILLLFFIGSSLLSDIQLIRNSTNFDYFLTTDWVRILEQQFPGQTFSLYDYKYKTTEQSLSLALQLDVAKKISPDGLKIGLWIATPSAHFTYPVVTGKMQAYQLVNLTGASVSHLTKQQWTPVNPSYLYTQTQDWYKKKP